MSKCAFCVSCHAVIVDTIRFLFSKNGIAFSLYKNLVKPVVLAIFQAINIQTIIYYSSIYNIKCFCNSRL